jgi:hypothetical protein
MTIYKEDDEARESFKGKNEDYIRYFETIILCNND